MNGLIIFFGVVLGVLIFLTALVLIVKNKIKNILNKFGYNNLNQIQEQIKQGELAYKTEPKYVTGMTKLLIPRIVQDFPNFSENELYNKVETDLLSIFNSLENQKLENNSGLVLIKEKLNQKIEDMKENKVIEKYDDIKFHRHALKYYKNKDGVLNISVSTSLEYYYIKKINGKLINKDEYKKQTVYTTEYIYVYDLNKISKNQNLIGINCPNCGAPVKDLGNKVCRYCNSGLEDINLKAWNIAIYKEEY